MMKRIGVFGVVTLGILVSLVVADAWADYEDPVRLPAIKMEAAKTSLILDVAKAGERVVGVGERGHVLFSDDLGNSWKQSTVPTRMQLNSVQFVSNETGFAVGEDQVIIKTDDGGVNWELVFEGSQSEIHGPFLDLLFTDSTSGYAVGVFNKLWRTVDGGLNWQNWEVNIDNVDEWHLIAIAATGEQKDRIYIASEMGILFRSVDGGESFEALQTAHDGSFHGVLARRTAAGDDQLVLFGVGGELWTTNDSGKSWNNVETQTEAGLAGGSWQADGSAVIVGADGVVLLLDSTLEKITKYQTDNGFPLSNVIPLEGGKLLMVGFGGFHEYILPK